MQRSESLVVGDVMQPFPDNVQKAGIDTLVMKHFLSAFNDKDAILILKHCSQVLAPQGKILLLQVLILPYVAFLFETSLPVFVCAPSHPSTHSCLLGIHQHCMLGRLRQEILMSLHCCHIRGFHPEPALRATELLQHGA